MITGNIDRIPFHPYFIFKDLVTIFLFLLVLSLIIFYAPNLFAHSDNYIEANPMSTPASIVPEWYLLPFYAILRSIPNKLLGVVAMFSSLLILLAMPLLDTNRTRSSVFVPIRRFSFFVLVGVFGVLMVVGGQHVENPWVLVGQIATSLYFAWFIIFIPLAGIIDNTFMDLAIIPVD